MIPDSASRTGRPAIPWLDGREAGRSVVPVGGLLVSFLSMATIEFQDATGKFQRREIPEVPGGAIVGRSPTCHVVVADPSVSRDHGRIRKTHEGWEYLHRSSTNPCRINDQLVTGPCLLKDGDRIRFGEIEAVFREGAPPRKGSGGNRVAEDRTLEDREVPQKVEPPVSSVRLEQHPRKTGQQPRDMTVGQGPPAGRGEPAKGATGSRPMVDPSLRVDPALLAELQRLKTENEALRALKGTPGRPGGDRAAELEEEVGHLKGLLGDAERRVENAESRAASAAAAMDGILRKSQDLRDQNIHLQGLLDSTRADLSNREAEAADLREKVAALTAQLDAVRGRTVQNSEEMSSLKVRLTEKDREIERLRRELDSREYDLRVLREESQRLEEYVKGDAGRQKDLERKLRNLEAVIDENRNLMATMRRDLERKEREVREVRLGVGIADLEQEKQRLLDDYHRKSREVDELRATQAENAAELAALRAERDDLEGRLRELEEAARSRRLEKEDISDHPDYRAAMRELETLREKVAGLGEAMETMRRDLAAGTETQAQVAAEGAAAAEKVRTLTQRVEELQRELEQRVAAQAGSAGASSGGGEASPALRGLVAQVESLEEDLMLLQGTIREVLPVIEALGAEPAQWSDRLRRALGGQDAGELHASLRNMQRMLAKDVQVLRQSLDAADLAEGESRQEDG